MVRQAHHERIFILTFVPSVNSGQALSLSKDDLAKVVLRLKGNGYPYGIRCNCGDVYVECVAATDELQILVQGC